MKQKRIVITRPPQQAAAFARQLADRGAIPLLLPLIGVQALEDTRQLDAALDELSTYDWLLFTSANTVTQVWARFAALNMQPTLPQVAAVGTSTAQALAQRGAAVHLMPRTHTAQALFEALQGAVALPGQRILLPQSDLAPPLLRDLLTSAGASVRAVAAYQVQQAQAAPELLRQPFDAITFTSASTVSSFCGLVENPLAILGAALVACIGPVTAQRARDYGLPVHVIAEPHTIDGLIAALAQAFERNPIR